MLRRNGCAVALTALVGVPAALLVALVLTQRRDSDLVDAVDRGDVGAVRAALARGADPNARREYGEEDRPVSRSMERLWGWTIRGDTFARMPVLLWALRGAEEDARQSPPVLFPRQADGEIVRMLLEHGADPNACFDGHTPLSVAASAGSAGAVKLLIGRGAKVNHPCGDYTPLMSAKGAEVAEVLIANGADVNLGAGEPPTSPLTQAICGRNAELAAALLAHGARPAATDLRQAVVAADAQIVRRLVRAGAKVDAADSFGPTALTVAAEGRVEVVRVLLAAGADPNPRGPYAGTPLCSAAECGRLDIARMLLDAGAHAEPGPSAGPAPLEAAAKCGAADVARLLLARGAKPNRRDRLGRTPLMWAANYGRRDTAVVLLQAGADPNAVASGGWTALSAAQHGRANGTPVVHQDLVDLLRRAGAKR